MQTNWIQFIESDADVTEAVVQHHLVEGLAGGGEGALGVGQDPVPLSRHSLNWIVIQVFHS